MKTINMTVDQNQGAIEKSHFVIKKAFPKYILVLFCIFALYLVIPVIDVPLIGLSLSAPIFFIVAFTIILKPPKAWLHEYRIWILIAGLLWFAIFLSTWVNGFMSGNLELRGILTVIRYVYWLLVFVVSVYFLSQGSTINTVTSVLGWGVLLLALLRWAEVLRYGNMGAWTGTHFLSQNNYGFLFSIFSPFLMVFVFKGHVWKKLFGWVGYLILLAAVAINGSRGSWVAIAVGLALCLFILMISRPRKFVSLSIMLVISVGVASAAWVAFPTVSSTVNKRFVTFDDLDTEKSYMIRQLMIQKAWRLFESSPIIGVGANRFTETVIELEIPSILSYASQDHFDDTSSHNSYLGFLAEYGLLGVLPYLALLIPLWIGGFLSACYFTRWGQYWAVAVFLAFIQMSIHMWVISSLTNTANWFIYGLASAAVVIWQKSKRENALRFSLSHSSSNA